MGEEVTSEARGYARISAGTFQLKCIINFVHGVTIVSQVLSYFFLSTTRMVYYSIKWGLEFLLATLDIVLSYVFTLYLFCHNGGLLLHTRI